MSRIWKNNSRTMYNYITLRRKQRKTVSGKLNCHINTCLVENTASSQKKVKFPGYPDKFHTFTLIISNSLFWNSEVWFQIAMFYWTIYGFLKEVAGRNYLLPIKMRFSDKEFQHLSHDTATQELMSETVSAVASNKKMAIITKYSLKQPKILGVQFELTGQDGTPELSMIFFLFDTTFGAIKCLFT
ncbi:hypothetical protein ACJX0J_022914 [Zea mays]